MTGANRQPESRGPRQRLIRKIERKQRMIEEYERIAHESEPGDERSQGTGEYFAKRAADFRAEKEALELQLQARMNARKRKAVSSSRNGHSSVTPAAAAQS